MKQFSYSPRTLCVLGLGLLWAGVSAVNADTSNPKAAVKPALSVQLTEAKSRNLTVSIQANGAVAPWQELVVGSLTSGLRVEEIGVEVGQVVKKGQVLARLEDDSVRADLAVAQATLMEAQANLDDLRATADMVRQLDAPGALSQQQINQAFANEKLALARLKSAQAQVAQQELRLKNTRLLAPDDGVVSSRSLVVGKIANPGEEFFRLIRRGRLEWRAELSDADLARVRKGQAAVVRLDAQSIRGTVRAVSPAVDSQARVGLVYVDLPSTATGLRAGAYVSGQLELGQQPCLAIPATAVVERDGFSAVYKVNTQTNRVQRIKVQLGSRQGDWVEVRSGLTAGDQVVQSGVAFLADGDLVKVVQ